MGWNEYEIIARGNHIIQKMNGLTTVDFTDNNTRFASRSGIIALQLHRNQGLPMRVEFKDIQLKNLAN